MQHILIDFENVQPNAEQLAHLNDEQCHIWLFLGHFQQRTLSLELCEALCRFGKNVHFVRVARTGKNALDFYLAYYLGKITEQDPAAAICILSRDGGFDVLVEHLVQHQHCQSIQRLANLIEIASTDATENQPTLNNVTETKIHEAEMVTAHTQAAFIQSCYKKALHYLLQRDSFRPTLRRNLVLRFQNWVLHDDLAPFTEEQQVETIDLVIDRLMQKGFITHSTDGLSVNYHVSDDDLFNLVLQHLLQSRPSTVQAAKNVLYTKANSLDLGVAEQDLDAMLAYCQQHQHLRVQANKIVYPPFEPTPNTIAATVIPKPQPEMWQNVQKFFTVYHKNKPQSQSALQKSFISYLKVDEAHAKQLIAYLVQQKKIHINDTGKIRYH